jgi:hypothetical protein
MIRGSALALGLFLAFAAPQASTPVLPSPPPFGALPSIPRVRLDVAREHVVAIEEIDLPRGDWRSGDLDFYVAFGAPGAPEAFDAHLLAVPDGALEPGESEVGERVATERAARRPPKAHELVGPPEMAGMVVHVSEGAFRRAVALGGMAALRLRTLLRLPREDGDGGRELLVRLGNARGTPLTLGRVQVASYENGAPIARAEARLCGTEADPWPLAVGLVPKPAAPARVTTPGPIAPVLAVRHPSDDLCVRFWLGEEPDAGVR